MRALRPVLFLALFAAAVAGAWMWFSGRSAGIGADAITVYYVKADGTTLVPWRVTLGPARDARSVAFYAATQAVAGPASGVDAVRFPAGTVVRGIDVDGTTADVDLSKEIASSAEGGFAESAEFKSLVWTLTQPPLPYKSVRVRINGARVATLPGGHLELDEPLARSSF